MKITKMGNMVVQPSKFMRYSSGGFSYSKGYCALRFADKKTAKSFAKTLLSEKAKNEDAYDGICPYEVRETDKDSSETIFHDIILFVRIDGDCTRKGMVTQRDLVFKLAAKNGALMATHWTC